MPRRNPGFSYSARIAILLGLVLVGLLVLLFVAPIPQDPDYHLFADTRALMGIPNFGDVVSNAGFALVGILGSIAVLGARQPPLFNNRDFARPYILFFAGIALVSLGSAYYHWEPGNERLLWDRLPMSVAFMAFVSAVIADRVHANAGNGWLMLVLIVLGITSLSYWFHTEQQGQGDLRFYAFVQFYPLIVLPFILWLFPRYYYVPGRYIAWVIAWYGLSKLLEFFDAEVFELMGYTISGHSLKHLAAAGSSLVILRMLTVQRYEGD
jgi:hypothetical protein